MTIEIPMENITTSDLVEELTQRGDLKAGDLYDILVHLLDFNLPAGFILYEKGKVVSPECNCKKLPEYSTGRLVKEILSRDDHESDFDVSYLDVFAKEPRFVPEHYLLLKAETLAEQQVLKDLKDTFTMMKA